MVCTIYLDVLPLPKFPRTHPCINPQMINKSPEEKLTNDNQRKIMTIKTN